jgi:hypothetical protein
MGVNGQHHAPVAFYQREMTPGTHCTGGWVQTGSGANPASCLFVVYLTTLFQYLRLYSVDFYSILIRLPSISEAGETRVRNSR